MNRVPPDPIDCQPEKLVAFYARITVYTIACFLNLNFIYLMVRVGMKAISPLLLSLTALLITTNVGASMV